MRARTFGLRNHPANRFNSPTSCGVEKRTLTARRWYRNIIAGACLVLCAVLGCLLGFYLGAAGAVGNIVPLAFTIAYALVIGSLVVHLRFCWRHQLQIDKGRIISRGLFAVTEICLADVTEVKWFPHGLGRVDLKTNFDKVTINFARYPPDVSLRMIQYLRDVLAKSMQQEWDRFCLRIGIPLRNPDSDSRRMEVAFSRAQFDRVLSSVFFADLAFAVGFWWLTGFRGNWTITALPLALTGLGWISLRYLVPVRYTTKVGWFPLAFFVDQLAHSLGWGFRLLGAVLLCVAFLSGIPRGLDLTIAVVVIIGVFESARPLIKCWTYFKGERDQDLKHSEAAVREWELLDRVDAAGHC